jgi:hypothetical protein
MSARIVSTVSEIGHTSMCGHWFPAQRLAVLLKKKMASTKRLELISSVSIFDELNLPERRTAAFCVIIGFSPTPPSVMPLTDDSPVPALS